MAGNRSFLLQAALAVTVAIALFVSHHNRRVYHINAEHGSVLEHDDGYNASWNGEHATTKSAVTPPTEWCGSSKHCSCMNASKDNICAKLEDLFLHSSHGVVVTVPKQRASSPDLTPVLSMLFDPQGPPLYGYHDCPAHVCFVNDAVTGDTDIALVDLALARSLISRLSTNRVCVAITDRENDVRKATDLARGKKHGDAAQLRVVTPGTGPKGKLRGMQASLMNKHPDAFLKSSVLGFEDRQASLVWIVDPQQCAALSDKTIRSSLQHVSSALGARLVAVNTTRCKHPVVDSLIRSRDERTVLKRCFQADLVRADCILTSFRAALIVATDNEVSAGVWAALAAGAVPVLLLADNGTPLASNLERLGLLKAVVMHRLADAVVKSARAVLQTSSVYSGYQTWRPRDAQSLKQPLATAITQQVGALICRLCDSVDKSKLKPLPGPTRPKQFSGNFSTGWQPQLQTKLQAIRDVGTSTAVPDTFEKCHKVFHRYKSVPSRWKGSRLRGVVERTYVVHWTRGAKRKAVMARDLSKAGLDVHFVTAFDGEEFKDEELQCTYKRFSEWDKKKRRGGGRVMSVAELSCALKHWAIYHSVIHDKVSAALVLEDDLRLLPEFGHHLVEIMQDLPTDFDFVWLVGVFLGSTKKNLCASYTDKAKLGRHLCPCNRKFYGTGGYIVSLKGAKRMFQHEFPFDHPIDMALRRTWKRRKDWKVLCTDQSLVRLAGGSFIGRQGRRQTVFDVP